MINNNNIFNDNQNKNNSNHNNNIQDYYKSMENNIDLINQQFNNINISGNELNEKIKNKTNNIIMNENRKQININQINENDINNNIIYNNKNITINSNKHYFNQEKQQLQPIINIPNITSNTITQNSINNQIQSNSFNSQINPYLINQSHPNQNMLKNNLIAEKRTEYLLNNCVSAYKGQIECRQLEGIIEAEPSLASKIIYPKIKDKIQEISFDQFGNYFIQKVIEHLTDEQIFEILQKKISINFRSFCFNQHGTRVIQKIFEKTVKNEQLLNYFNNLLNPNLKDFVIDSNASHIIIKYVNILSSPKNDFIIKFLLDNSYELAMKKYSCCVLQKCIEYSNDEQKKEFLKNIAMKSYCLFNDQYGNYVVQYCINLCDYEINKIFVDNFLNNIIKLSTQKYSSNIIEKCMDCCDESTKDLIYQKYCNKEIVQKLLFDMYGNYVLQKVMMLSKEPFSTKYIEMVGPLMKNLNNYNFGPRLYNKLITSFPSLSMYIGINTKNNRNKKYKNKKYKNNMNMNEFVNNIYVNNSYNMNNVNSNINHGNNNNGQLFMMPGINNNYYIPFQLNNNINNISNINNKIPLQNLLNNNNNNFAMNSNIVNNNLNNLLQFQQNMSRNNNIDIPNNYYNTNQ